jgi:hypothetical protein
MLTFSISNPWATLSPSGKDLSPTAEIDPLLSHLTTTLAFLSRTLAPAPLRRIARAVIATVNATLWDSVLQRSFSTQGAAQLNADLAAICAVVDKQVGAGVAEVGLRKCLEAATLVGLPVRGAKSTSLTHTSDDGGVRDEAGMEDWDAWAADESEPSAPADTNTNIDTDVDPDAEVDTQAPGLWEVEKRLFADNQSARLVLEQLGLEVLDEKDARRVLRLRVELAG